MVLIMNPMNDSVLEAIEQQKEIIAKQNEIIAKLVNENVEQENIINELMKNYLNE